jgi:hypothetical protein
MLSTTTSYDDLIHSTDATNLLEELSRAELSLLASIKKCRVCEQNKPRSEFPRHRHSHDNFDSRCRDCKNREKRLRDAFKRQYPAPPPGPCPLCRKYTENWVLDHCHHTDQPRGYICNRCNTSLGGFDDNPDFIRRALNWVERPQTPTFSNHPPRHLL